MISGPAEFPLRVVYLTQSPGDFALDVPAYALAHTLRQQGDACLVGVGKLPLPSLTVAKADRYGIEQVYLPLETRFAGWHPLLRRFQPHIIHFGPDIPTAMSHKLIKTLHLARRATVILEDPVHPSHLTPQDNAMWHPVLYSTPISAACYQRYQDALAKAMRAYGPTLLNMPVEKEAEI